jgi:hypothetical protein
MWQLPLHLKAVGVCNPYALVEMAVTPEKREALRKVLPWLNYRYSKVELEEVRLEEARMPKGEVEAMVEAGQVEIVTAEMHVRGTVKLFCVPEYQKNRRRAIKNTQRINELYGRDTLGNCKLLTRKQHLSAVHRGKYAACVDMAAFYDQVPLGEQAREFMCFTKDGITYRLTRLPMGQRHSVQIAQAMAECLVDFALPQGVMAQAYVDNIRFVADDKEALRKALGILRLRCEAVGITMNEDLTKADDIISHEGEFLGLHFNYQRKTVRVGKKTIAKLKATSEEMDRWTYRNYLGHMGLLFYGSAPLRIDLARRFYAIKFYREVATLLQERPYLLDTPIALRPSCIEQLKGWTEEVLRNEDTPVKKEDEPATAILITDASKWGWGAIYLQVDTGKVRTVSQQWDKPFVGRKKSTWAEPEAIARAGCYFLEPSEKGRVIILTDSSTAVGAYTKGYSPAFAVNKAVVKLKQNFPLRDIECLHLAGDLNLADPYSRNQAVLQEPSAKVIADLVLGAQRNPPSRSNEPSSSAD